MSEATTAALTDVIYDRLTELDITSDLDNEQVYEAARMAARTIEDAGTIKAIIRAWLAEVGLTARDLENSAHSGAELWAEQVADAIREVQL